MRKWISLGAGCQSRFRANFWLTSPTATAAFPHPREAHALAVGHAGGDEAGSEARFALRHFLLRAAQAVPPGSALRGARQRSAQDLLDLFETQHQLLSLLPGQVISQRIVIVHEQVPSFKVKA